jgi:signal transduction histidine kinase
VLVLEAGAEFRAPLSALRSTYLVAAGLSLLLAGLFCAGLLVALRALERARIAHGRAERLATVGQMAAMVAHEVRNPLGILRAQIELQRERLGAAAGDRERGRFGEMLVEVDRLNQLTNEFLALARDQPLEPHRCDLGPLLRGAAESVTLATGPRDAAIAVEVPAELMIEVDAQKLHQAVYNLVANAAQVGGKGVSIRVQAARGPQSVTVTVSDDGPGVPAALRETLFEPFVSGRSGGSGLGLAIARRIVERHGGELGFAPASADGRGAVFTMRLPTGGPG